MPYAVDKMKAPAILTEEVWTLIGRITEGSWKDQGLLSKMFHKIIGRLKKPPQECTRRFQLMWSVLQKRGTLKFLMKNSSTLLPSVSIRLKGKMPGKSDTVE